MSEQLTLSLRLDDEATFSNFYVGENEHAVSQLREMALGSGLQFIYLWGKTKVGCSHLLQAACHYAHEQGATVFYLPFSIDPDIQPQILEGLENFNLVCLDNLEGVVGNAKWEEALFNFYNHCMASKTKLLVAARYSPHEIDINLLDLKSRMMHGVTFQIYPLSDEEKVRAIQTRAKLRGLQLSTEVGNFILKRYPRTMSELCLALDDLDRASLSAQRKLTIPFVKEVLKI